MSKVRKEKRIKIFQIMLGKEMIKGSDIIRVNDSEINIVEVVSGCQNRRISMHNRIRKVSIM